MASTGLPVGLLSGHGYHELEVGLYVRWLFGIRFFDLAYPAGAGLAIINQASQDAVCGPICAPEL